MIDALTSPGMLALLSLLGAGIAVLGRASRDIFKYIDARAEKTVSAEKEARLRLEQMLNTRIHQLETQVDKLLASNALYQRRIYQLEAKLIENDIDLPSMPGWPPI